MKRQLHMVFVVVLLALMPALHTAGAQDNAPQVAPPEDGPMGVLAEFNVAELPTPHAEVWFVRMQLEPEGTLPESPQMGPVVVYVETGELTLATDVEIEVDAASAGEPVSATPDAGVQTVLAGGDSAMIPAGTMMAATNASDAPVTFLVVMMYAAELEGTMDMNTGEPVGLTQSLLSAGGTEFPPMPGTVTIERVEIPADEPTTNMHMAGTELGVVEEGRGAVTFTSFDTSTMIWPGIQNAYADNVRVPLTGSAQLTEGDGYVTAGTATMWIPMGDPIVVMRVVAGPDMMP